MKKLDENPDQQKPANEPQPADPSPTIYKSLKEIEPVGVNDKGSYVDRDGTLWMPAPQRNDAYWAPIFPEGPPFLQRLTFQFAETMAEVPHRWTKRTPRRMRPTMRRCGIPSTTTA